MHPTVHRRAFASCTWLACLLSGSVKACEGPMGLLCPTCSTDTEHIGAAFNTFECCACTCRRPVGEFTARATCISSILPRLCKWGGGSHRSVRGETGGAILALCYQARLGAYLLQLRQIRRYPKFQNQLHLLSHCALYNKVRVYRGHLT